ncbi:MAG TPA: peptide-methionine (S)-S-oxide reductase MsrA [Aquabacterium sp.]|uniref:peptide-methionine (S)-S-oxide reductase MsrA n=1 Tax=Aquabacterium sp. TaxID=1872578 RepID=UPI002E31C941|nr:peptide-methionine (S)-S-oxide reductase MsrA [Aquabacterium sp.]HEX5371794.1 peptide-methionine (S)-S-oxide reductase MsrA [Aquabacterium sp.]
MTTSPLELATFAGGCFWCTEAVFSRVRGVVHVEPGYSNGHDRHPSYDKVCSGQTGHAEVVQVRFDPAVVGYDELLDVFFTTHDPTTLNRQGNDTGTQYRSAIFTHSEAQAAAAHAHMAALTEQGAYGGARIVTEVAPVDNYHPAEAYHHNYFEHHPHEGYCTFVVAPKVAKFRHAFPDLDTRRA